MNVGKRARANAMLTVASAIWGFAFVAQRVGAQVVGPMTFNSVRFAMAAAAVGGLVAFLDHRRGLSRERRRAATRRALVPGLICGSLLALAGGLQQAGMTGPSGTTAGSAAFITGLYMVLVPLAGLFFGRRIGWRIVVGVVCAVCGLYLICVTDGLTIGWGNLLVLASAFAWTGHILCIDHYSKRTSALRLAAVQFVGCSLVSAIAAPVVDPAPFAGIWEAIVPLLYGGLLAGGVAFTLQVVAQRDAHPTHASLIMALEAVFGALGGALLLSENMGLRGYFGAALMVAGVVVSQLGRRPGDRRRGSYAAAPPTQAADGR